MLLVALLTAAPPANSASGDWHQMADDELAKVIPDRAAVESEQIETELRSASGVRDATGRIIAAVVLITAGYSAEGKYSHWLTTQATLRIGRVTLPPGDYVVGYRTGDGSSLLVSFYKALSGRLVGAAPARKESLTGPIRSIYVSAVGADGFSIQIGRFLLRFDVVD
jgi:hypothetical protein